MRSDVPLWRETSWGEVAELAYGKALRERSADGGVVVYGTNGPTGRVAQKLGDGPTVVIGRKGAYRGVHYAPGPFWVIDTAFFLVPGSAIDITWAYYELLTHDINGLDSGSAIPSTRREDFYAMRVAVPPLREQGRIVAVLRTLDEKIDRSHRLARLLEQIAATLFRARFVDFVGVEEFEPSELGQVPDGWHVKRVSDLCVTQYGFTATASEDAVGPKFLRVKDINKRPWIDWSEVPYCEASGDQLAKYRLRRGDIVVARMADPGKVAMCEEPHEDAVFASYLVRLTTENLAWTYFLYGFLSSHLYQDAYVSAAAGGSVQKNMNAKIIVAAPLLVPPEAEIEAFGDLVGPLRERMAAAVREAAALSRVRDALLPKLISGQIQVPDTNDPEEIIGPVADEVGAQS